jgi:hypothetical protein
MQMLSKKPQQRYFTTKTVLQEIESWPLAESMRLDPVHPESALAQSAKIALDSYNRCLTDPSFLTRFYERLQSNEAVAPKLGSMIFDSQVELIKPAIRHLLEHARGQQDAQLEIERMGKRHSGYALVEDDLLTFVDTLIDVAVELDGKSPDESAALRAAWQTATAHGLRRFCEAAAIARAPVPILSGVVPSGEARNPGVERAPRARG